MEEIVEAYVNEDLPLEEWDLDKLLSKVQEFIYLLNELKSSELSGLEVNELKEFLKEQMRNAYDLKEGQIEEKRSGLIKQMLDLAFLSQGMLKGEELTKFISRSVDLLK